MKIHPIFLIGILSYILITILGILNISIPNWSSGAAFTILVVGIIFQAISGR